MAKGQRNDRQEWKKRNKRKRARHGHATTSRAAHDLSGSFAKLARLSGGNAAQLRLRVPCHGHAIITITNLSAIVSHLGRDFRRILLLHSLTANTNPHSQSLPQTSFARSSAFCHISTDGTCSRGEKMGIVMGVVHSSLTCFVPSGRSSSLA